MSKKLMQRDRCFEGWY
uniref:Uncharacterized protein n=1 Tax=Arundo donax TaxID=35708 RepID=A0A0A9C6M0_ARUDO